MSAELQVSRDSVMVLAKTGRQASWHRLTEDERRSAEREHVDLMLSVAARHRMRRLEGFRLIGQQGRWQRFWLIEFPTFAGAEEWIEAEMAPPYGRDGFYEYHLTRPLAPDHFDAWLPGPPRVIAPQEADPAAIPALGADRSSVVVLQFSPFRWRRRARRCRADRGPATGCPRAWDAAAGVLPAHRPRPGVAPRLDLRVPGPGRRRGVDRGGGGPGAARRAPGASPSCRAAGRPNTSPPGAGPKAEALRPSPRGVSAST